MEQIREVLDRYDAVSLGEIGGERPQELIGDYIQGESRLAYGLQL